MDSSDSSLVVTHLLAEGFTDDEKEMFLMNFESFINHDQHNDFVVDFDNAYKWIGFTRKNNAKRLLTTVLMEGKDYILLLRKKQRFSEEEPVQNGGQNKETIMLTPNAFKELCIHSRTERGDQVRKYYLSLETIINQRFRLEMDKMKAENETQRDQIAGLIAIESENKAMLYVFDTDSTNPNSHKKLGYTAKPADRFKPYYQTHPKGRIDFHIMIPRVNLKTAERALHEDLKNAGYSAGGEVYDISTSDARMYLTQIKHKFQIADISDPIERRAKLGHIIVEGDYVLNNKPRPITRPMMFDQGTQTDPCYIQPLETPEDPPVQSDAEINQLPFPNYECPMHMRKVTDQKYEFDRFITECCTTVADRPGGALGNSVADLEVSSVDITGAYRLWARSATKEAFHALLDYMKRRFQPDRLSLQKDAVGVVNGFKGVSLAPRDPPVLSLTPTDVETFVHSCCDFVPSGKMLFARLQDEFVEWRRRVHGSASDADTARLKSYIRNHKDVLKANVWTSDGNGNGYYGIVMKSSPPLRARTPSLTSKRVNKVDVRTGMVLDTWPSVAKAAASVGMAPAKMSRSISGGIAFDGNIVYTSTEF